MADFPFLLSFAGDSRKQEVLVSNKIQYKQQKDYLTALQRNNKKTDSASTLDNKRDGHSAELWPTLTGR